MINQLIKEINIALENNLFLVALNTALTLPDICGKAEYPDISYKHNGERYKKWYQEHIGQYEQSPLDLREGVTMPYLSADVVYQLRCEMLHQGNPNVSKSKTGIDKFTLWVQKANPFGFYGDTASVSLSGEPCKTYNVSVRRLCLLLCRTAENYYNNNKEKFAFFNYTIFDLDVRNELIRNKHKELEKEAKEIQAMLKGERL